MNDFRNCTKAGLGFAVVAGLSASVALGEGSELPDGSVIIPAIPFADTGDTSDNLHDFDAVCPFAGSLSPDVFYMYTHDGSTPGITIALCESGYDTKTYVLDTSFAELACNDDFCSSTGGGGFRSTIECLALAAGQTVHIAVDGWSGDLGVYDLIVDGCEPPPACIFTDECPAGALLEGEVCQSDPSIDIFNGGCNSDSVSPLLSAVSCGDTLCGETTVLINTTRDTDWYVLSTAGSNDVTMTVVGEAPLLTGRIAEGAGCVPGAPDCACIAGTVDPAAFPLPCEEGTVTSTVVAGDSWWFVAAAGFTVDIPCGAEEQGNDYVASWTCAASSCCTLGDANEDASVDFNDLVILLANWGPCSG
jgi:hypothetical protein